MFFNANIPVLQNEFLKDLNIVGYLELQWDDSRLSWEKTQWKVDKLQIHSANHIWIPVLSSQAYETSLRNDDVMEVRRLETSNRGSKFASIMHATVLQGYSHNHRISLL